MKACDCRLALTVILLRHAEKIKDKNAVPCFEVTVGGKTPEV